MNAEYTPVHGTCTTHCNARGTRRAGRWQDAVTGVILIAAALLIVAPAEADFVSSPVTTAQVGVPYVYEAQATGVGLVAITAPNGLPPWLTLEQTGNGTAALRGTPRPGDSGLGIVLRSEDSSCRLFLILCYRYQLFDITIIENMPPQVVPAGIPDQTAVESRPFTLDVGSAFQDPDGDPLTLAATGLPDGFTLSGGTIAGTPAPRHVSRSPYDVRITASDGRGGTADTAFTLRIEPLGRADLAVTSIAVSPSPLVASDRATLSITAENHGPDESGSATLAIELGGQAFSLDAHQCTAEVLDGGQRLVCELEPLAPGAAATIEFDGVAEGVGDVYVVASVSPLASRPIDPDRSNDRLTAAANVGGAISAARAQKVGGPAVALVAADLDGDGFDDVIAATADEGPAALHLNVEKPSTLHESLRATEDERRGLSELPLSFGDDAVAAAVAVADFDGDGHLDAAVVGAAVTVFINDGSGVLSETDSLNGSDTPRAVAAADLDGDGDADLVVANANGNMVYLNRSGAGFDPAPLGGGGLEPVDVVIVDLDGDGLPEIVFANADGDASQYSSTGSGFTSATAIATGPTASVATGDFNGDGFPDLVFARIQPGPDGLPSNPVYFSDGVGGMALAAELGASPTADVLVADIDGDGQLDIVAINETGVHQVFLNDGQGGFTQHPTLLVEPGAVAGAAARIGMRATTDLVIASEAGLAVFLNDGSGNLGLGDTARPVIELIGAAEIALEVETPYEDPGATAMDDVDGALTPIIDNPVDTKVIGTYVVTYTAIDSAGNAAVPATRTVRVEARVAQGGGGGGAADVALLAMTGAALLLSLLGFTARLSRGQQRFSLRAAQSVTDRGREVGGLMPRRALGLGFARDEGAAEFARGGAEETPKR